MLRPLTLAALAATLALGLAACGSRNSGESAADYAGKVGGAAAPAASATASANLPQAAASGPKAVAFATPYAQVDPATGDKRGLTIEPDGTFELVENGQTTRGTYAWLPDGKRLRLNGVADHPIVLVANGALYRLTNENVPLDDLTPDRMYTAGAR